LGHSYWNNLADSGTTGLQQFWLESPDVMEAFPAGFAEGTRNVWQEFAQYAQDNNWTTAFQYYLNNKRSYSGSNSLWTLEEQYVADDFRADAWFMGLSRQGWEAADAPDTHFNWRIDTSTRWPQNWGQLKGICTLRVQGDGKNWDYRQDRYRRYTEQSQESRWWYGTGPSRTAPLTDIGAQILEHWSHGLDGGTPYWDNFANNWTTATGSDTGGDADLSLLLSGDNVPGHGSPYDGRIATIRMKAMRHGQQLCELLNMVSGATDWNRNRTAHALSNAYGDHTGRGYDAYGGDAYTGMRIWDYHKLHADLTATLAASSCDADSDGDGTLDCNDGCPLDAQKTEPGVCGCDMADNDSDGDGTLDCNDGCPADLAKIAPGVCGCGIADTDSDGDGTPDCNDDSPNGDPGDGDGGDGGGSGGGCFIGITRR
jgi:hypothetical protein